jgi:hypothetical protein
MLRMLLTTALLLTTSPAWAIKCYKGPFTANVDMTKPIPTNARFVVEFQQLTPEEDLQVELLGPRGVKVELTIAERAEAHAILVPAAPLAPHSLYQLSGGHDGLVNAKFRTGAAADNDTPASPLVQSVSREFYESATGVDDHVQIVVDPASDASYWELEMSADLMFAKPIRTISARPTVTAGKKRCVTNAPTYDPTSDYYLRLRAVDAAGNPSEWAMLPKTMATRK